MGSAATDVVHGIAVDAPPEVGVWTPGGTPRFLSGSTTLGPQAHRLRPRRQRRGPDFLHPGPHLLLSDVFTLRCGPQAAREKQGPGR